MKSPLLCCDLAGLAPLELDQLARACRQRLAAGERLLTLYGRATDAARSRYAVNALFLAPGGTPQLLRAHAYAGQRYPALSADFPAAQIFERELWEQTGLVPDGHPWLKPVRFEGQRQRRMADYPFFSVHGAQVHEVGVGPIHAGVIEPGHFRFMCLGESVHHLEIQLGYQHRGVEALLLRRAQRAPLALAPWVESVCGDSCVAYTAAYCAALEALSGRPADFGTKLLRAVAMEMERVAVHLATLNGLATDIAFVQGTGTYGRLRTAMINASQRVSGNRFGRGWLRPGRARGIDAARRDDLIATFAATARDVAGINELMQSAWSVRARFKGTGTVSRKVAVDLGLSGVAARASGVDTDTRSELPGSVYGHLPLALQSEDGGDCWARMRLRMREIDAALGWLLGVLGDRTLDLDCGHWQEPPGVAPLRPDALCVALAEGPRGCVLQAIETGHDGRIAHYKLQDPSLPNWFGLAMALRDTPISDFPICNKSFDLSYCGNDL